jgi:hypothetical protein
MFSLHPQSRAALVPMPRVLVSEHARRLHHDKKVSIAIQLVFVMFTFVAFARLDATDFANE